MPTLREIFGNSVTSSNDRVIRVRDRKPKQCSIITNIEEVPFVRRCPNEKMHTLDVCMDHAYSVNYILDGVERTAYFSTIGKANRFRWRTPSWTECNYSVVDS